MGNNIELDNFFLGITFILEVNFEGNLLFSLPITIKVLEFLCVGSSRWKEGHVRQGTFFCFLPHKQLRTDQSPGFISNESHIQLSIDDIHTDFTSFHGLFIPTSHNGMAGRRHRRVKVDFRSDTR